LLWLKVPPLIVKFSKVLRTAATLSVPDGAVKVPACRVKSPLMLADAPPAKLIVVLLLLSVICGRVAPDGTTKLWSPGPSISRSVPWGPYDPPKPAPTDTAPCASIVPAPDAPSTPLVSVRVPLAVIVAP